MQAILALEDGRVFRGKGYGAKGECCGEVVFNTSITGYQEIFTDPSYCGQIVVLTNPEIGNYGTNPEDNEATRPYIEGLVVREFSRVSSNWRSQQVAEEYLEQFKIPVLAEIDSRALVRHLRDHGVMRGVISTLESDAEKLVVKARSIPKMDGTDLAKVVTTNRPYVWEVGERSHEPVEVVGVKDEPARFHVVAYDYGIKQNILRKLRGEGCKVTVVPAQTPAEDVLALKPDGVFLSNGPGDPEPCAYAVDNIKRLMGRQPIFGICLGHQLVGITLVLLCLPLHGTTCVAGKSFKVRQVCGTVTDKPGAAISDAKIELVPKGHPEGVQEIPSDQEGGFAFSNVPDGQYELRVKFRGFWDAWQPFVVNRSHEERKCSRPIRVVMVTAGACSYVKNAWKK